MAVWCVGSVLGCSQPPLQEGILGHSLCCLWPDMQRTEPDLLHELGDEPPPRLILMSRAPRSVPSAWPHGFTLLYPCHSLFDLFLGWAGAGSGSSSSLAVRHGQTLNRISLVCAQPGLHAFHIRRFKTCFSSGAHTRNMLTY